MGTHELYEVGKRIGAAARFRGNQLVAGAIAAFFVGAVLFNYVDARGKRIRKENGVAEAAKIAAQGERERKAAQEAKATQEQKEYEALPIEAKNRIAFGKLIQTTYQAEGRLMAVRATGENFDTLELSSGLICETCSTLDAAREAVDPEMLKMLKHLKFKRVLIKGTQSGFSEGYLVQ
jgi:hypothetical protein